MSQRHWIVTAAVAGLCAGILVLFTDIEVTFVRWVNCGPFASEAERRDSDLCR
jgi:hypothetical protein